MKLNNKGFAISTILYGLLALLILVIMLIFQIMRTTNNNTKELGESINKELNQCREYRIKYNSCISFDKEGSCKDANVNYSTCLDCAKAADFNACMTDKGLSI